MPDLRLALSSLQCPVQLPPSTRDRIEDSTWSTQCKPKQGSFSISTESLILQTVKKPFQGNWKLFKKAPYSFPRRPVLTLKNLSEGVVGPCTKLLRHFRIFFNFAPGNNLLYFKNGTKSRPPPHPFSKLFSPNSLLVHFLMFHRKQHWNRGGGNCGKHFCQDQCNRQFFCNVFQRVLSKVVVPFFRIYMSTSG